MEATGTTTGGLAHPILACAATMSAALKDVADVDPMFMSPADQAAALLDLTRIADQVAELRGRVLAQSGQVAAAEGARDPAAWLAHHARTGRAARRWAALAAALARWARVGDAVRQGTVNGEQAAAIVRALDDLPADLDPRVREACESRLVAEADHFGPAQLAVLGRRILDVIDPDHADARDARALDDEEREASRRTFLRWHSNGDGTTTFRGRVSDAVFARFLAYLEAFANPRRTAPAGSPGGPAAATAEGSDPAGAATGPTTEQTAYPRGPAEDRRPYDQRLGHALGDFLESVDPDRMPRHGGDATTVLITLDAELLKTQLEGIGWIGDQPITAAQVRRLACQAGLVPLVLGGESQILDQGRARRLATPAQRKALALRHPACQAEGCDIPNTWCEAHHLTPWASGGATDLTNLVLLCSFHHHRAHDAHFETTHHPTGVVSFHRRT